MPRRREVPKRLIDPDPQYGSALLAKFINVLMVSGKKSVAEHVVYTALDEMQKQVSKSKESDREDATTLHKTQSLTKLVLEYFEQALDNVRPVVEVRSRRVGGATYQVPIEVRYDRSIALGIRWLISAARARSEKGMIFKLAGELRDAYNKKGSAVKKREDMHKMAKANQAFAHFRWH